MPTMKQQFAKDIIELINKNNNTQFPIYIPGRGNIVKTDDDKFMLTNINMTPIPFEDDSFENPVIIKGPTGDIGPKGNTGDKGNSGPIGPAGTLKGPQGINGTNGIQIPGSVGPKGDIGDTSGDQGAFIQREYFVYSTQMTQININVNNGNTEIIASRNFSEPSPTIQNKLANIYIQFAATFNALQTLSIPASFIISIDRKKGSADFSGFANEKQNFTYTYYVTTKDPYHTFYTALNVLLPGTGSNGSGYTSEVYIYCENNTGCDMILTNFNCVIHYID